MSETNGQFKAYIDRILRLREEVDTINSDVREVYAEMKGEGYDKTVAGRLVAEIRARAKDASKVDEQDTVLGLYRDAYFGTGLATHAHAREAAE